MRRASPPTQLLAAAAATDANTATSTAVIMSSRPPHRGRGRGFSGRQYSGGRGQFVTGDAHFRSVRDTNLGLRRNEEGSFPNQTQHRNPPFNQVPPPPYHQNPQFRYPPPYNYAQQFRPRPPFDKKQATHPPQHLRPRPPDYRDWEYAATPPPRDCERFMVLSYNILADYLAIDHRHKLYFHIPRHMLDWQWRKRNITFELGLWSADIMCLQEVDRFHELEEELKFKGYSGIWKMRTGNPVDGCAIFWRRSRFNLLYEECIEFNKLGLRDNVAQICVLELINQNGSIPSSLTGSCKVVICNIHVLYNPNRGEIKLGQVRVLLDRAKAVSKSWNDAPVVICGDFNCTPKSPLYNFITEQKLDLSGIDRDKVSGQASCAIRTQRLYGPKSSERSANGSLQAKSIADDNEVNVEQSKILSDMQNPANQDESIENQSAHTVLDMSDKSRTNLQYEKESGTLYDALKDTQLTSVDNSKIFGDVDCVKEESNASYSEEQISDAVPFSKHKSLSEKSNLYVPKENEHIEFYSYPTSSLEDNQSSAVKIDPESTDFLISEVSSTNPSSQTSVSDAIEAPQLVYRESPSFELIANDGMDSSSTSYEVDKSHQSANIDFPLNEKLQKMSLNEIDKAIIDGEDTGEDDNTISALHEAKDGLPHDLGQSMKPELEMSGQFQDLESASNNLLHAQSEVEDELSPSLNSKSIDGDKTTYNPSLWTPVEIETATGNAGCTFLEHSLPLRSTYTEVTDSSGTRDPDGEPLVTSYNRCFLGTVDYIWRTEGLETIRVLAPIPKQAMEWTPGFPTKKWGSDHIALVSELAFLKDVANISRDVQ